MAKENSGRRRRELQMKKTAFIVFLLVLLLIVSYVVTYILTTDEVSADHDVQTTTLHGKGPNARVGLGAAMGGSGASSSSDVENGSSNFCDEFAISSEGDLSSTPRIAIFHHSKTSNEFSADSATRTSLQSAVDVGMYEYFQICVAQHKHHHKVSLTLTRLPYGDTRKAEGELDLYISADVKRPTSEFGSTWISRDNGDDQITIPTYTEDYQASNSHSLYVGVHNREDGGAWGNSAFRHSVQFSLDVAIVDVSQSEILKRGNLRANGQRLLPGQAPKLDEVRRDTKKWGGNYAV